MSKKKATEEASGYNNLEMMSVGEILTNINREDQKVAQVIKSVIPKIEKVVDEIESRMLAGGRLFYIGSGTSGRLGIVDASECPPTFGVDHGLVIGLIAGGDSAIRKAVEFAEDDENAGWEDLKLYNVNSKDSVIGIAASGTTPYVIGAIKKCALNSIYTSAITCNEGSDLAIAANDPIEVVVGPEFVTGSTRMKAGTAQKLVLNMISTALMIRMGRVKGNKMVDMQLSNNKLVERGIQMLMEEIHVDKQRAAELLEEFGSVRKAIDKYKN